MNRHRNRTIKRLVRNLLLPMVVSATLLLAFASSTRAQTIGSCVSVETDAPVVLPDGTEHAAGSLELCVRRLYSPVAVLHEVRVNGDNVGQFMSRSRTAEGRGRSMREPLFLFGRQAGGNLVLEGFSMAEGSEIRAFSLRHPGSV
jgi:hypothetical protein